MYISNNVILYSLSRFVLISLCQLLINCQYRIVSQMQPIGMIKFAVWNSFALLRQSVASAFTLVFILLYFCVLLQCVVGLCCFYYVLSVSYIDLPSGVIKNDDDDDFHIKCCHVIHVIHVIRYMDYGVKA